jgi:hypothetical protein
MILDKNAILQAPDLKKETVSVPEWGENAEVIVQEMTALDRDRLRNDLYDDKGEYDSVNQAAKILVRCIVSPDGSRLFSDSDAEALGKKSLSAIQRLFAIAQKLNAVQPITEEEVKN